MALKKQSFSKPQLLVFILVFAILGGIVIYKSFAANPNLPGDINNDNTVNITDLSILLTNYGTTNTTADLNNDGAVNITDLSILLSHFGQSASPVPTVSITASPTTITSGQSSTLTWNSTNATSCTASGAWIGTKATSGTQIVTPTTTSTYSLSCSGAGGSSSASATVTVTGAPPTSAYFTGYSSSDWEHCVPSTCNGIKNVSSPLQTGLSNTIQMSLGPGFSGTRQDSNSEKTQLWLDSHQDSAHAYKGYTFGGNGSETWDKHYVYLASNFVASPGEWNWTEQWHNDSGYTQCSTPGGWEEVNYQIGIYHNSGQTDRWFARTYGGTSSAPGNGSTKYEASGPTVARGKWTEFVSHIKWSPDATKGLVEIWVDGQQIASKQTPTLYYRCNSAISYVNYQLGYYRYNPSSLNLPDATIYIAGAIMGPTRSSIGF